MFIAPNINKNPRLSCSMNSLPNVAAWPEPIPGRKEHKGAKRIDAPADLKNSFFVRNISFKGEMICFGRDVFDFREKRRLERPKRPDKRGRRGSFIGR